MHRLILILSAVFAISATAIAADLPPEFYKYQFEGHVEAVKAMAEGRSSNPARIKALTIADVKFIGSRVDQDSKDKDLYATIELKDGSSVEVKLKGEDRKQFDTKVREYICQPGRLAGNKAACK